jgi:hypothetical protein
MDEFIKRTVSAGNTLGWSAGYTVLFIMYFMIFYEFRIFIKFGPLIKIMGLMVEKLIQVMVIYIYILFMFSQLAESYLFG